MKNDVISKMKIDVNFQIKTVKSLSFAIIMYLKIIPLLRDDELKINSPLYTQAS